MKILQVKEYNRQDMNRWHERVAEWHKSNDNNIIPQIAFVGFRNTRGEMRNNGFVCCGDNWAKWFKTKKEALLCNR